MKIISYKKLLITFSILISASIGIAYACADGDWDYFGFSNFTPETFVEKSYLPLSFSPDEMFYGIGYDTEYTSRFNEEIISDWTTYMSGKMSSSQVNFFLLDDKSASVVVDLYKAQTENEANMNATSWSTQLDLKDAKVKEFIEFLYFAKDVEACSSKQSEPWNYDQVDDSPKADVSLIADIKKRFESSKSPFLKNRYWFQAVKANFYSDSIPLTIEFFNKTADKVPKNTLYYRALAYVAGAYYREQNYSQANYCYSQVFDKCPSLRVVTAYNFHPQAEQDWQEALTLAKTNDEKSALWALLGYYADTERAISEIYKLNPKNPHINYLLPRLINSMEMAVHDDVKESTRTYKLNLIGKLDKQQLDLVTLIASEEKTSNSFLWFMGAGYLQSLNGNFNLAKSSYAKAETLAPATLLAKNQLHLLQFINTLSSLDTINKANEAILLPDLKWLYSIAKDTTSGSLRYDNATNWSKDYLSALYKASNNTIFAELFKRNGEYYQSDSQLEAMKSFLLKTNKTPFEELAQSVYPLGLDDIYSYQAIVYTFQDKLDLAKIAIDKAESLRDQEFYGNPFNGKIQDCHDCDHQAVQKTKYSMQDFITLMNTLKANIAKGDDPYNNNLLLANAFYNISYYGNGRTFYQSNIFNPYLDFYNKMILDNTLAKTYYQEAFDLASVDEQRAKCSYMMAKCERNDYYTATYSNTSNFPGWGDNTNADFLAWDNFKRLKENYSTTRYYQDVIEECGYFKTYLSK